MKLTAQTWSEYVARLARLNQRAGQLMADYIAAHGTGDTDALIAYAHALVTKYGEGSAELACQMYDALAAAARAFRKRFPGIAITVRAPEELLMVPMDPILIIQVLNNLLENAVIHGRTTTAVRLSVTREGENARFSVADNGQGIPVDALPRLFDGTLKHNETTKGDGKRNMGLGLSVCRAIVRAHGGHLNARNLEQGAEFCFTLPLTKEESA